MLQLVKSSALVVAGLWVGVLFCLGFVVAPYLFILASRQNPSVPNSGVAADLIGPLLYGSDVLSLGVGVLVASALAFLRRRGEVGLGGRWFLPEIGVGLAAMCASANYWWFAPRIKLLQGELAARYGAFHLADKADPLFRRFDSLHHLSTNVFTVGLVAALVCLVGLSRFRPKALSSAATPA